MEEILLPPRMFAAGDEPVGDRINSYHKIKTTRAIIKALEPEELEFLMNSTFGRILAIDSHLPFSGAFGQHVIFCTVETAINMLENKVVKTRELRIKIACLAITSSILFASSHIPRINPEHVELIRDLDDFLAFPWGRASYTMLASSIKGKDEIALSKPSVAIRGYVEAIQLIFLAAVPQLKEEVTQTERLVIVDSESDGETNTCEETMTADDNLAGQVKPPQATKFCLIPGHAKTADSECQVPVKSILDDPYEEWSAGLDFQWVDESEDLAVDNMVRLILEDFVFRKEMFKGGLTAIELSRLRAEKKLKDKEPKEKNEKDHAAEVSEGEGSSDFLDIISSMEKRIYQALDAKLEKLVPPTSQSQQAALLQSTMSRCLKDLDKKIGDSLGRQLKDMQAAIIKGVIDVLGEPFSTRAGLVGNTSNITPGDGKEPPVFDFTNPSEAADSRINDVLRDLNLVSDVSLPATTEASPVPQTERVPDVDDAHPQAEHTEEHVDDSAPTDLLEQQVEANTHTEQLFSANATALLEEPPISDESEALVEQIEGHVKRFHTFSLRENEHCQTIF
ncbi:Uncharacterized protein Rs2_20262 [Raphanus sativus]|nr:Uncharacterized protein Rs2_20262 [Raphanus sativus]